jgi:hypothetical protein
MPHASLRPRVNVVLMATCGVAAIGLSLVAQRLPTVTLLVGAAAGAAVGRSQRRSLREAAVAFRGADTALEVRRVLASTRSGKIGLWIQWGGVAARWELTSCRGRSLPAAEVGRSATHRLL